MASTYRLIPYRTQLIDALKESHKNVENVIEASLIEPPFGLLGTPWQGIIFSFTTQYIVVYDKSYTTWGEMEI